MNTIKATGVSLLAIISLLLLVTFYYVIIAFALIAFVVLVGIVAKKLLDIQSRISKQKM